ncbi:MAG TPA: hypothetical protein VNO34_06205 [Actinomycetota bacterium]|nr:hypothetical protein [Actinomycetota bacterium]
MSGPEASEAKGRMRVRAAAFVLIVGVALSQWARPALGVLGASRAVGSNAFTTATLEPPTGLAASASCAGLLAAKVSLTWTATVSTFADGYDVHRSTTDGGPYTKIAHLSGRGTTSYTDQSVALGTTYYYVVQATAVSWTSGNSGQAQATTPLLCA